MSRRAITDLLADIDEVLAGRGRQEWLTICELMDELGESWNKNPAVTGRGIFRLNGKESFSHYAAWMRGNLYSYPDVASALEQHKYKQRIGVRWNNDRGEIDVTVWGSR